MLLAFETATNTCSVALHDGTRVVAHVTVQRPRIHAEQLLPLSQVVLKQAGVSVQDLNAIAVSEGPGSYTGLRIGVSAAKGLALAADAALVGVSSLAALAEQARSMVEPGAGICALFDARRTEAYAGAFLVQEDGSLELAQPIAGVLMEDLADWLPDASRWICMGDGAAKVESVVSALPGVSRIVPLSTIAPSAVTVAKLGWAKFQAGEADDLAAFEPFYLKAFVAKTPKRTLFERLPF
ncbi:MAG: tRNA (adenosine(37)-N6)-threonylcarbamoyltransferase complex dimerization subunit type 1 TsaB [Rhodothermales bacterium]